MKFFFAVAAILNFQIAHGAIFQSGSFFPAASQFIIDTDTNDVCEAQTYKAWTNDDMAKATKGLVACEPVVDDAAKTVTVDYAACAAAPAVAAACEAHSFSYNVACVDDNAGSGWIVLYAAMPGCAGEACTDAYLDDYADTAEDMMEKGLKRGFSEGDGGMPGTDWDCTVTLPSTNWDFTVTLPSTNPLADVMDTLINKEYFFDSGNPWMLSFMMNEKDAACYSEMEAIYSDETFLNALDEVSTDCHPNLEMGDTFVFMTADYTACNEVGNVDAVCSAASGTHTVLPDILISCMIVKDDPGVYLTDLDDSSYLADAIIKSVGLCLGVSCPTELDEAVEKQAEIALETEIESGLTVFLATMGVEGTVECNVDIDSDTLDLAILDLAIQ